MAYSVMSDLPLRRVLDCLSGEFLTLEEIAKLYAPKNPLSLEAWLRYSAVMRRKMFNEKKGPELEQHLSRLVEYGYVEELSAKQHPCHPHISFRKEKVFYCLTSKGRSAQLSVIKKKK